MQVSKKSKKVLPQAGSQIMVLTHIIDWGTVTDKFGSKRKVEFGWELPDDRHVFDEAVGEQPLMVFRKFGRTLGRGSEMAKCIGGMLGKDINDLLDEEGNFDLESLLGIACQGQITLVKDGQYTNEQLGSFSTLPKSERRQFAPEGETILLDLDNFDDQAFNRIIDWKQKEIAKSPEFKALEIALPEGTEEQAEPEPQRSTAPAQRPTAGNTKSANLFGGKSATPAKPAPAATQAKPAPKPAPKPAAKPAGKKR